MSIPIPVFWSLLKESRLLAAEQCQQLAADFGQVKGASDQSNARTLAEWLVARNVLSRYQTMILLAGRPGPFHYGDYKVYDRIEKGRLAGCFRAVHGPTGHPVLLHFLTGQVISDPAAWADAVQNTLSAATIQSPHVQRFYEPVDLGSFKFVVSEDLRGVTLDERLAMGRFPPAEACRLARMAALGLAQLHQSGRAHGDVRPANLFLDTSVQGHPGDVKVLFDPHVVLGPVNFAQESAKLTAMSDYLAPELMHAGHLPDPLSDVYALGCTLYCLLSGSPPFVGGTVLQKMTRHASEGIRPLEPLGVPQPLAQLVTYMLAKNPQVRYQSPAIVAEQLAALIDPAQLYSLPAQPLPTQATYEHWVQQKQAALAAAAAPQPEPEPEPQRFSLGIQQAGEAVVAAKSGGPALAGVAIAGAAPSSTARFVTPQELAAKREKEQTKSVITALVGIGAVVISLIIVVYAMNQKPPTNRPTEVTQVVKPKPPSELTSIEELQRRADQNSAYGKPQPAGKNKTPTEAPVQPGGNTDPPQPGNNSPQNPSTPQTVALETGPVQQVVPDDGQLLWASPTAGAPVELKLVPPEGQVFFVIRPADMLASSEGAKVLEALGPQFGAGRAAWEKAAGLELGEIEQLVITLHNNEAKFPRVSYAVRTKNRLPSNDLLTRWGNPAAAKEGNNTYYQGQQYNYYLADAPEGTNLFLLGDPLDVKEVTKSGGAPPLMARDLARLLRSMDGERHFNLLFNPDFFDSDDGEPLFRGVYSKIRQPLDLFLGDELEAGLVSMHFGPAFYLEARMLGQVNRDRHALANDFRARLKQVPDSIEQFLFLIDPPPYWKRVANRYRGMVVDLHDAMRIGVEGDQAVINAYLPGPAAHNLVLGGELLVSSTPGAVAGPATTVAAATPKGPKTLEEVMALKSKMEFAAQSLEFVMNDVMADAQEVAKGSPFGKGGEKEFTIKILGDDLQLDGITRNQTVRDFKKEGTLAEILTEIVVTANSRKPPDDPEQKLIWVIGPDPDNPAKELVLITTKAQAAKKKYNVPAVFQAKGK